MSQAYSRLKELRTIGYQFTSRAHRPCMDRIVNRRSSLLATPDFIVEENLSLRPETIVAIHPVFVNSIEDLRLPIIASHKFLIKFSGQQCFIKPQGTHFNPFHIVRSMEDLGVSISWSKCTWEYREEMGHLYGLQSSERLSKCGGEFRQKKGKSVEEENIHTEHGNI